jgi:pyridinium-3,5-bisthiocarboxylic acid mononucleotide nickel chelatase
MRIAYLDCFSGMSGDMFLGALIDAGVPASRFEETVAALNIGARLEVSRVRRSGISATKVDVLVHGEKELPHEVFWEQQQARELEHAQSHAGQVHSHGEHSHPVRGRNESSQHAKPGAAEPARHQHAHARGLKEIKEIIAQAAISSGAKQTAIRIFEALGEAEAKVHDTEIGSIHFHEVGAVDAMVDMVCAAVGAEALGVEEWVCSPLNVGGGTVTCSHGTMPVPAPATVELLKGAPVYSSGLNVELVTPTGAAIVKTLAKRFGAFPEMTIEKTGYGAGTRDFSGQANVVRLTVGEARTGVPAPYEIKEETITVLEANLDDLNPQVFGYVMDRLLEEGALDVFGAPVQMKKNRPGIVLTALCRTEDAARLAHLIFAETTTLGVRRREERRQILERKWITVATRWGEVRLKVASMNGTIANYAPEYEDCRRIASEHHVPLKNVIQEAMQAYVGLRGKER